MMRLQRGIFGVMITTKNLENPQVIKEKILQAYLCVNDAWHQESRDRNS